MQQAPTWLPYRLRNAIDQARINAALKIVDRTRPYPAVDHADADAQISMLMCKRDLRLGVVALKSLLRFDDVRLAASFINDGTITAIGSTALTINPATQGFTNTGTMQAMGTGGFVFDGTGGGIDTFTNTGQIIDILAGSKLDLINNAVVSGGTLAVTGSGVINPLGVGGVILEGVTITDTDTASATVVQGDDQLVTIVTGLTNDGKWEMNSTGSATVTPPSRRAAPARLSWATTPTTAFSRHFHRS